MAEPILARSPAASPTPLPPLVDGERMDQATFHERYEVSAPEFRAELIGGIVHVSSPVHGPHAEGHGALMAWLSDYWLATPGTRFYDNGTVILGDESEVQPDAALFIDPARGGQTRDEEGLLIGPPELVVEVADSSVGHDLRAKRLDYEEGGVREYIVIDLKSTLVHWFERSGAFFRPLDPDADGVLRSRVFPGLWLDPVALIRREMSRVIDVLNQGLNYADHAAFVERLKG